jgi:plasmid stabilization system protein ParE
MTVRLIVANAARRDLREILGYLQQQAGAKVALRYALEFDAGIDRIAEFPLSGSPRPQYGSDIRLAIVNPYLIFYDVVAATGEIVVLRILHGHRNITRMMLRNVR